MATSPTLDDLILTARRRLAAAGIPNAALDARLLAGAAFGLDRLGLIMNGSRTPGARETKIFAQLLRRRLGGEPVGRILGRREFRGIPFVLSPATLEPRPDTETLVEEAVRLVERGEIPGVPPNGDGLIFADIGTGSGAIAVSVAAVLPAARAIATDISKEALRTAAQNAAAAGVAARISFREGSYVMPLQGERFGLILSNPPYIPTAAVAGLAPEVRRHDPIAALDGGPDGLDAYRALCAGARPLLERGGALILEIGFDQAAAVTALLGRSGFPRVVVIKDLAGNDRVVVAH